VQYGVNGTSQNFPSPFCSPSAALLVQNHRFVNRMGVTTNGLLAFTKCTINNADVSHTHVNEF